MVCLGYIPGHLPAYDAYEDTQDEQGYQEAYANPVEENYAEVDQEYYEEDSYSEQSVEPDPEWEAEARAFCQEQAEYELPEERAQFVKDCVDSQLGY